MANSFNSMPIYLDTDTTVIGNTNWRGSSGFTLSTPKGIRVTKVIIQQDLGTVATVTGSVIVNDPQQTTGALLDFEVTGVTQPPVEIHLDGANAGWRDFVVTGLTATKTNMQIWYRA